jgi:hypothetical protein
MQSKKIDQLIDKVENYLECWKQFYRFVTLGCNKKFSQEDDLQFLEVKSLLVQELELILASVDVASPSKDEVHQLVSGAPSLRYLSELNSEAVRNLENQWHRVYIGWQAILGQLKVQQTSEQSRSGFSSLFGSRKK